MSDKPTFIDPKTEEEKMENTEPALHRRKKLPRIPQRILPERRRKIRIPSPDKMRRGDPCGFPKRKEMSSRKRTIQRPGNR